MSNTKEQKTPYEIVMGIENLLGNVPVKGLSKGYGYLFLRYGQIGELTFDIIRHKLTDAIDNISQGRYNFATSALSSAKGDWYLAADVAKRLERYPPDEFHMIRPHLQKGGGNQSPSFRKVLRVSLDIWNAYEKQLQNKSISLKEIHHNIGVRQSYNELYLLTQSMLNFDTAYQSFQNAHWVVAKRIIGFKGITPSGKDVLDLEKRAMKPLFKELWEAIPLE